MIILYHSPVPKHTLWFSLAFYFHLAGVILWTIGMSLDISYPAAISNWMTSAPNDEAAALAVMSTLSPLGFGRGLFPLNVLLNWLAFAFLSTAMLQNRYFSRWLGWLGLLCGLFGMFLAIIMTFSGREAFIQPFVILFALTILWWLAIGLALVRKK